MRQKKATDCYIFETNESFLPKKMTPKKYVNTFAENSVLDSLLEGFRLVDREWRYQYVNETAARHSRLKKEAMLGRAMTEVHPGIENTELFATLRSSMLQRKAARCENRFTYTDGTTAWFELRIEPIPEGIFILSLDITDRKNAELETRLLSQKLEEKIARESAELELLRREQHNSLRYACRIQHAHLPDKTEIMKVFPESFILYKPKAIVSGDFYFFHRAGRCAYIASADCAGQGFPQALLGMLCADKLTSFICGHPHLPDLFSRLNHEIFSMLAQTDDSGTCQDGVNIGLCAMDVFTRRLLFCGANRPLWIIRRSEREVEQINGMKLPLGKYASNEQDFPLHTIQLSRGDTFYLFSDGYVGMSGGTDQKKLTSKRFKDLLLSIQHKSMGEQEKYLDAFAEKWQQGNEQADDILVIGVRV